MSDAGVLTYDAQAYVNAERNIWSTRICQLSPCIIFFYDYLLTLDREVEYIWKRPIITSNILYLAVRFGGGGIVLLDAIGFMSDSTSRQFCGGFLRFQGWLSFCVLWAVQLILQLRVYALYKSSGKILAVMAIGFTAEVLTMTAFLSVGMVKTQNTNKPVTGASTIVCAVTKAPAILTYVWLPNIAFGALLFALAARVGFKRGSLGFNISHMERRDLVDALVHGNVHYFLGMLAVNVANTGVWLGLGYTMFESSEGFAAVIEVILGCRMVLDLLSAASRPGGLHISDPIPLRPPSFGARPGTYYSAVSTYDLEASQGFHQLTGAAEASSSGETTRVMEEIR